MWLKLACVIVATTLVSGCADKFRTDSYSPPTSAISPAAKALIVTSENGSYNGKPYANSGNMLTTQVEIAITSHFAQTSVTAEKDVAAALAQARSNAIEYVIEPKILHWEDRATEWSGRPDRITIKLVVWDAKSGEAIATSLESASSKWATFGGDHPQDLLPKLLASWSNKVF